MTIPQGMCVGAREGGVSDWKTSENILVRGGTEKKGPGKEQPEGLEGPVRAREEGIVEDEASR